MALENIQRFLGALLYDCVSGLSANKLDAFWARAIQQFQVTMRRRAMFLSLADVDGMLGAAANPSQSAAGFRTQQSEWSRRCVKEIKRPSGRALKYCVAVPRVRCNPDMPAASIAPLDNCVKIGSRHPGICHCEPKGSGKEVHWFSSIHNSLAANLDLSIPLVRQNGVAHASQLSALVQVANILPVLALHFTWIIFSTANVFPFDSGERPACLPHRRFDV